MESLKSSLESILSTVQKLPEKDALVIFLFVRNVVETVEAYLACGETFDVDTLLSECCLGFQQADDVIVQRKDEGIQVDTVVQDQVTQTYQLVKNKVQVIQVSQDPEPQKSAGNDEPYYVSINSETGAEENSDQPQTVLECSDPSVLQAFLEEGGKLPSYLPPGTQIIIETEDGRTEILQNKAEPVEGEQDTEAAVASIKSADAQDEDTEDSENIPVFVMTEDGEMLVDASQIDPALQQQIQQQTAAEAGTPVKRKLLVSSSPPSAKKVKLEGEDSSTPSGSFQCDKCFQCFTHEHSLHRHYRAQHLQMKWTCDTCGREFTRADSLVNHRKNGSCFKGPGRNKAGTPASGYMCTECDLHFKTAVLLEKHREAKHTTDTQPQGLEEINEISTGEDKSPARRRAAAAGGKQPDELFLCQECGQCLGSKNALQSHMRKHTGVVPFKCQFCGHGTNTRANLLKHLDSIHGVTKDDPNVSLDLKDYSKPEGEPENSGTNVESNTHADESHMTVYISTMDNEHQTQTTDPDNTKDSQLKVKREQYEENEIRLEVAGFLPDEIPSTHYNPKGPATPKSTFLLGDDMHRGPNPVGRPRKSGLEPVCQVCGKKYHNHSNLAVHMRSHTKEQLFECEVCDKKFPTKMNMIRHTQTVHEGRRDFKCDVCDKAYSEKKTLLLHQRTVHEGEKPYQCDQCPMTFSNKGPLNMHRAKHLEENSLECSICDRYFSTKHALSAHVRLHSEQDFACEDCQLNFVSQTDLRSHSKVAHSTENQVTSDLRRHSKVAHSTENQVTCDLCCKKFANKEDFSTHLRNMHTKEKPFKCQLCTGVSFYSNNSLQRHMEKEHPDGFSPPEKTTDPESEITINITTSNSQSVELSPSTPRQADETEETPEDS